MTEGFSTWMISGVPVSVPEFTVLQLEHFSPYRVLTTPKICLSTTRMICRKSLPKKKLETSDLFPSCYLLSRLGTSTRNKWNSNKGKLCLGCRLLSCLVLENCLKTRTQGAQAPQAKAETSWLERYSERLKAWENQAARSSSGVPDQSPCWLPHTAQL